MTVKELEERVGMTRANIRFYEQEGLLSPARLENGYRDYSETDAETLRKIKLFRSLHLDLDAIRKLQRGELTLTQALGAQLEALEKDQAALDRARQVCEELKGTQADWSTLDPKPWLEKLERPPVPVSPRYAPPPDIAPPPESTLYPWRRYFARGIDFGLCELVQIAVFYLVFRWRAPLTQPLNLLYQLFTGYVVWGLVFLLEPVCLHRFGATPGKAIFAISVKDANGNNLTWKQALRRTWGVFSQGFGYGIPIYSQWRLWKSRKQCKNGAREDWEGYLDRRRTFYWETYRVADDGGWRYAACVGVNVLIVVLAVAINWYSFLPPNRGPLTEAEFYENCAFYVRYLDAGDVRMTEDGHLFLLPSLPYEPGLHGVGGEFSVTLTDGVVTGVTVTSAAETASGLWVSASSQQVAFLAFVGSFPEVGSTALQDAFREMKKHISGAGWDHDHWQTFSSDDSALPTFTVRQTTELKHFERTTYPYFSAQRGRTAAFRQVFTVTLSDEDGPDRDHLVLSF